MTTHGPWAGPELGPAVQRVRSGKCSRADGRTAHPLITGLIALLTPFVFGAIGAVVGSYLLNLSLGGTVLLGTLAASASYIAAPAAMRSAVPQANPGLSLTCALGVTFPFNIIVGIPIYEHVARWLHRAA